MLALDVPPSFRVPSCTILFWIRTVTVLKNYLPRTYHPLHLTVKAGPTSTSSKIELLKVRHINHPENLWRVLVGNTSRLSSSAEIVRQVSWNSNLNYTQLAIAAKKKCCLGSAVSHYLFIMSKEQPFCNQKWWRLCPTNCWEISGTYTRQKLWEIHMPECISASNHRW